MSLVGCKEWRRAGKSECVAVGEIGRVWVEKQEGFYDIGVRDALKNFS
jgi:hypothetical protein